MKVDPTIIPTKKSKAEEWIAWHKSLKSYFGSHKISNDIFIKAWAKRGSSDANTSSLVLYAKENGMKIESSSLTQELNIFGREWVENITMFSKVGTYGLGIIILLAIAGLAYKLVRNPKGTMQIISMATPAGRAANIGSKMLKS
jgi:hypothetical protein